MKNALSETPKPVLQELRYGAQPDDSDVNQVHAGSIDFDSDTPLVCQRDQSGDVTCESCQ